MQNQNLHFSIFEELQCGCSRFVLFLCCSFLGNIALSQKIKTTQDNRFESLLKTAKEENLSVSERKKFAQEAKEIAEKKGNGPNKAKALQVIGQIQLSNGNYGKAYSSFDEAIQILKNVKPTDFDLKDKASIYNMAGVSLKNLSIYNKALEEYQEAIRISNSIHWEQGKSIVYNNLFELYFIQNDLKKAYEFLSRAHQINKKTNNDKLLFDTMNNLLLYHISANNKDSVEIYVEKALDLTQKSQNNYNQAFLLNNLGFYYIEQKNYPKAESYLQQSLSISKTNGFQEIIAHSLYSFSKLYFLQKKYDESLLRADEGLNLCDQLKISKLQVDFLNLKGDLFAQEGNYKTAFNLVKAKESMQDSLSRNQNKLQAKDLEAFYIQESKEFQKQLSQKEIEILKNRNKFYMLLGGSIFLLGLLISGYSYFLIRKNKLLKLKNEIISKQKEREMQLELDYKNRQLTTISIGKITEKEYYGELVDGMNEIIFSKTLSSPAKQKLIALRNKIISEVSHEVWDDFKIHFEEIHPKFYGHLLEKFPNLSSNDLKLCAFIKLGFSTKEIANIYHKNIRTIESSRLKLRKIFDLSPQDSLELFIKTFH